MPVKSHKVNRRQKIRTRKMIRSNVGKLLPPLDVRSNGDLSGFLKRITKGPITIVMIYADWCGHCQTMKPIFDSASNSSQRSCQVVKVKDDMIDKVNASIKRINSSARPVEVQGYPTIVAMDNQGNKVTEINAVKNEKVMTSVMNESGNLALQAKMNVKQGVPSIELGETVTEQTAEGAEVAEAAEAEAAEAAEGAEGAAEEENLTLSLASPPKINLSLNTNPTKIPNGITATADSIKRYDKEPPYTGTIGGSLYSVMSQTAYTLAPAALLLATASAVMNRRTHKRLKLKSKSKSKSKRRSNRK